MPPRNNRVISTGAWIQIALVAASLAFMLPRLLSPQFGLFDDGVTLANSRLILSGDFTVGSDQETGRFRPLYWGYNTLLAWIGQESPLVFFLGNLVLLSGTVLLIYSIARKAGASQLAAGLAGFLFLISGPTVEGSYTLSKSEPLQVLLLLAGLWFSLSSLPLAGRIVLSAITFCLASLVKETSLVIIPIAAGWLVLILASRRAGRQAVTAQTAWILLASAVLAAALFFIGRSFVQSGGITSGTYVNGYSLSMAAIKSSLVRWLGWLLRDFSQLLLLGGIWILLVFLSRKRTGWGIELASLIWMGGWIAVFLPWEYMVEYYMLPFTAGAAVFMGCVVDRIVSVVKSGQLLQRIPAAAALALAGVLLLTTAANNLTSMQIQLSMDQANQDMMRALASLEPGSTYVISNQEESEYTKVIPFILDVIYDRPDLKIGLFDGKPVPAGTYTLMPVILNQPRMTVRLGIDEPTQASWNQQFEAALNPGSAQKLHQITRSFKMTGVNLPRLFCSFLPGSNYCSASTPLLDTRKFEYGWMIGKITG